MYTTKTSKNKSLLKANSNYKQYPFHGKRSSIRKAVEKRMYLNDPKNAQEIKDKRMLLQATFDAKKSAKIAAGWVSKDNSHYLEYLTNKATAKTMYSLTGTAIKVETKRRAKQSEQDIAKFKVEYEKLKAEYVPTGNKADNPAFNGVGNRRSDRGSIVAEIKAGTYWRYNKTSKSPKGLYGAEKRYDHSLKFNLRREMILLNVQAKWDHKMLAIEKAIEANDAINMKRMNRTILIHPHTEQKLNNAA